MDKDHSETVVMAACGLVGYVKILMCLAVTVSLNPFWAVRKICLTTVGIELLGIFNKFQAQNKDSKAWFTLVVRIGDFLLLAYVNKY